MPDPNIDGALARVTAALARHEDRPSQRRMAAAVGEALGRRRHLVVQAGTGTGKSLGYLVPTLVLGARVVVSTATKALQDQLATRDLPLLEERLGVPFTWAVLKGRSNYLCRQRAREVASGGDQLPLAAAVPEPAPLPSDEQLSLDPSAPSPPPGGPAGSARVRTPLRSPAAAPSPPGSTTGGLDGGLGPLGREVRRLLTWGETAITGDRAELDWEPTAHAWAQVSVGVRDCPGRTKCPSGEVCFAEGARDRAAEADVVIVNTHLYAAHLAAGAAVLPAHDVVVFDEAHELEDITSTSLGFELTGGRLQALARSARPLLSDTGVCDSVDDAGARLAQAVSGLGGKRLTRPLPTGVEDPLRLGRERVAALGAALRRSAGTTTAVGGVDDSPRRQRAQQLTLHLLGDLDQLLDLPESKVAWVESGAHSPTLRVAPLDVGVSLRALLWDGESAPTAVLTSATIPPGLGGRIGLDPGSFDELDVGSPFDYRRQALLYCPLHLPEPRHPDWEQAGHDELVRLIEAAGGRTLALFTSWRGMQAAAEDVRHRVPWAVLTQADLPKPALVERFAADEQSCLFATMGFWQGVDVPGAALSMVVIDKLPFPRPDDPLLQARRERVGRAAFTTIDVPRAATLLAQGVGRLIRTADDRGVVAVLDRRLGTASYRWDLVRALPPMPRTRELSAVRDFLAPLRTTAAAQVGRGDAHGPIEDQADAGHRRAAPAVSSRGAPGPSDGSATPGPP